MSVKKKPNGKYLVDIRDENGVRIERTFNSNSEAKVYEAKNTKVKYENMLVNNKLKPRRYSIEAALDDFANSKSDLRDSSITKYQHVILQLKLFCKSMQIDFVDEFSTEHATILAKELKKERAVMRGNKPMKISAKPKTVNFYFATYRAFFQREIIKGNLERSPMLHIKNLKINKKRPDYYTIEELKKFFAQEMPNSYRFAFIGLLYTGMRFAEMANLTWEDIDFRDKLIYIRSKDGFMTKTHNAERSIPMHAILEKLIIELLEVKMSETYVFTTSIGTQIKERGMLKICKKVALKAEIKSRAFLHKFRSTYATTLIQRGVPIQNIKELLGHWSVIETETYANNKSNNLHNDVSKLENLLS